MLVVGQLPLPVIVVHYSCRLVCSEVSDPIAATSSVFRTDLQLEGASNRRPVNQNQDQDVFSNLKNLKLGLVELKLIE